MKLPENLYYTKDHEWVRVEGDTGVVGITDYAQSELGDIVYLEIDTMDEDLDAEAVFGTVEAVKTVSDLFMPVSGTIIEVNTALEDKPELVNNDAFGEGWLIKIKLKDPSELENLLRANEYSELTGA